MIMQRSSRRSGKRTAPVDRRGRRFMWLWALVLLSLCRPGAARRRPRGAKPECEVVSRAQYHGDSVASYHGPVNAVEWPSQLFLREKRMRLIPACCTGVAIMLLLPARGYAQEKMDKMAPMPGMAAPM